jgi:hypothetical protein
VSAERARSGLSVEDGDASPIRCVPVPVRPDAASWSAFPVSTSHCCTARQENNGLLAPPATGCGKSG